MILIASGAYLEGEFVSEVGLLPPSFLPIGNRRLYEYQVDFIRSNQKENDEVFLSVPSSYKLEDYDRKKLKSLDVTVLQVPDELTLGESILYSWSSTAKTYTSLKILHGDTLFQNLVVPLGDVISIHKNLGYYRRAILNETDGLIKGINDDWSEDSKSVISGYFSFAKPLVLMRLLIQARNDFVEAISEYNKILPLKAVKSGTWLDFGHINSFFNSRTVITTQRAFNSLKINRRTVTKKSKSNPRKIVAESKWFEELPRRLRIYTPHLLSRIAEVDSEDEPYYELEYLQLLPLNDLFVFAKLNKSRWKNIFVGIHCFLEDMSKHKPEKITNQQLAMYDALYLEKTLARLKDYRAESGRDIDSKAVVLKDGTKLSLREIAENTQEYIKKCEQKDISIVHGDLCFSNILFDTRSESVKCIDPRGITPQNEPSIYGDKRYDLAKLYHSVIGMYDFIVAERYSIELEENGFSALNFPGRGDLIENVEKIFLAQIIELSDYEETEILAITIQLFLSMLPLHYESKSKQNAFLNNAIRLYEKLLERQR